MPLASSPPLSGEDLEEGLMSVINRLDPVPHLSLDAALRMVLAAENLADAGLSWQQTLSLVTRQGPESVNPKPYSLDP